MQNVSNDTSTTLFPRLSLTLFVRLLEPTLVNGVRFNNAMVASLGRLGRLGLVSVSTKLAKQI
jgi:hypothetical protein